MPRRSPGRGGRPRGCRVALEPEQHLVEDDIVQDLCPETLELFGEPARVLAAALDHRPDPRPAEGADCRVDRKASGAPRGFRVPIHLLALLGLAVDEVRGPHRHGAAVGFRFAHKTIPES